MFSHGTTPTLYLCVCHLNDELLCMSSASRCVFRGIQHSTCSILNRVCMFAWGNQSGPIVILLHPSNKVLTIDSKIS
jgi:hypothetical protein